MSDVSSPTNKERIVDTKLEPENGMEVTSSGNGSVTFNTGGRSFYSWTSIIYPISACEPHVVH